MSDRARYTRDRPPHQTHKRSFVPRLRPFLGYAAIVIAPDRRIAAIGTTVISAASNPKGDGAMVGFLIIFGTCIAGYAGVGLWVIAVAASGLLALSYAGRQRLLSRAVEIGAASFAEHSLLSSLFNALCATGAAYAFGLFLRAI